MRQPIEASEAQKAAGPSCANERAFRTTENGSVVHFFREAPIQ